MAMRLINNPFIKDFEILQLQYFNKKHLEFDSYINYIGNYNKSKSVKKSLYKSFKNKTSILANNHENELYDGIGDYIICRSFSDVNLINRLLQDNELKAQVFDKDIGYALKLLNWLINIYSEKQICNMLLSGRRKLIFDIFLTAKKITKADSSVFKKYFKKCKCSAKSIHNELIRMNQFINNRDLYKTKYLYSKEELEMEKQVKHFTFKLPKNEFELYCWAEKLHNCMLSYSSLIKDKHTIIYGIYKNDILSYAVEIDGKNILEISGKYNNPMSKKNKKIVEKWLQKSDFILESYMQT
jgi:hypothetical protein